MTYNDYSIVNKFIKMKMLYSYVQYYIDKFRKDTKPKILLLLQNHLVPVTRPFVISTMLERDAPVVEM